MNKERALTHRRCSQAHVHTHTLLFLLQVKLVVINLAAIFFLLRHASLPEPSASVEAINSSLSAVCLFKRFLEYWAC